LGGLKAKKGNEQRVQFQDATSILFVERLFQAGETIAD
jgi:hypothetical protein